MTFTHSVKMLLTPGAVSSIIGKYEKAQRFRTRTHPPSSVRGKLDPGRYARHRCEQEHRYQADDRRRQGVRAAHHDEHVRGVTARRIQCDEIWSFVYSKQKNVATAKRKDLAYGDAWTWTAIDADSKLIISYLVGGRDSDYAIALMDDLRARLVNRVQLTTDGHRAYLEAIEGAFGGDIDYAMLIKLYGAAPETAKGRYSPRRMHWLAQDAH